MNHPAKILCLCLLMGIQSSAQIDKKVTYSHRVMYDYTFQPDSLDESLKISGDMILLLGKDYSNFMAYETYLADSVMLALRERGTAHLAGEAAMSTSLQGQRLSRPRINFELFKDYKSYFQYLTNRFGVHHAEYVDLLQTPDWSLADDDSAVIAGYKCKKAITRFAGRDYIAWYTKELAMNGGPYKFHGLPGLVLLVYDTRRHHVFTAKAVFRERKIIELREERGMFYHRFRSKENFLAYNKEMKEHPEKMFEQPLISIPEEKLRLMAEKLKEEIAKNNNAIELE